MPSSQSSKPAPSLTPLLLILALLTGLLSSMVYLVDQNLERFYVFDTTHLHDLSQRAIAAHGDDTRGVVAYIVKELHEKNPAHVNLNEEWVFNNAGGAMGAMYIIHASECHSLATPLLKSQKGEKRGS